MAGITHLAEFQQNNLNKVVDALAKENNEAATIPFPSHTQRIL